MVSEVQPSGPAQRRGIGERCVITEVNDARIASEDDLRNALDLVSPGEVVGVTATCPQMGASQSEIPLAIEALRDSRSAVATQRRSATSLK